MYAKRRFERGISLEVKENPKSFWKFVRSKTQTRSGISDLKNKDGEWITNDKDKANEMNGFLALYSQKMKTIIFPISREDQTVQSVT